jgi:sterol desaturase/sphingolipid hydroxylase (fatty acid hydroxylase superfamily)
LGTFWGGILGALIYEFLVYWWHRSMHTFKPLWLMFHQLHHSAERVDTYGAYYFSLLDMIGWTILQSLSLVLIIGITPSAATIAIIITSFLGIFQHTNVKTPHWLGYIFQRPESHSIHHGKNIHRYNYSDLPVFDIIFGTFRNPKTFEVEVGFYPGASERIWEMLAFKDIYKN